MRRIVMWSTALMVGIVGLVVTGGAPAYATAPPLQIDNTGSHKCLTVFGANGLVQLPCTNVTEEPRVFRTADY
jgi:hypothetical protein